MKDTFTPQAILTDVARGKINKPLAFDLLLSLIEKSDNPDLRKECILALKKLGIYQENTEKMYKVIENILLSDVSPFVRNSAAVLISKQLLKYGLDALRWTIQHDSSPIVINTLFQKFKDNNVDISKELISDLNDWLVNYADNLNIVPQEALFFLEVECLFARHINNYEISEDSFNYFRYLINQPSPHPFIHIKNRHVEALYYNFFNWLYLKQNQDIIHSFTKIKDLAFFLSLHKQYDLKYKDPLSLPNSIGVLNHLKILDLNSNGIRCIPKFIFSLSNLQKLDLSKNYIEEIPNSFMKLKRLKVLNLKKNLFNDIPTELDDYLSTLDQFQY